MPHGPVAPVIHLYKAFTELSHPFAPKFENAANQAIHTMTTLAKVWILCTAMAATGGLYRLGALALKKIWLTISIPFFVLILASS